MSEIPREIRHVVDVTPRQDQVEHHLEDDCVCGPRLSPVKREDGSMGWVRVHHSLDGREANDE